MTDFAAIDFETANEQRSSVCSVGIVIVRDGLIVEKYHSLIRPVPNYYTFFTTRVHGMSYGDTAQARSFPFVWKEVESLIGNLPLVAHNSMFDEGCLKAVFGVYGMEYPDYRFICTWRASKKAYRNLPNHQLQTVAMHCGYHLEHHHHALADAEACAIIAQAIL